MKHYFEIGFLDDPEFPVMTIMGALFERLHLVLAKNNISTIGVSFPDAAKTLGARLRLHGSQSELLSLMGTRFFKGFGDYITLTPVLEVPSDCKYRVVQRVQVKSNTARLLRRSVRKGKISADEAQNFSKNAAKEKRLADPFISMRSRSTGQSFRLFVRHGEIASSFQSGVFNSYGLSSSATVPWFN